MMTKYKNLTNMTVVKTFDIPIDFELIEATNVKLSELGEIVKAEKYREEEVVKMIIDVNNNLKQINTLPQGFSEKYKKDIEKWIHEMDEKKKPFYLYLDEMAEVIDIDMDNEENLKEKIELTEKFNKKYSDNNTKKIITNAFDFDIEKAVLLQSQSLFIKFARQRRNIRLFTDYVFKFRYHFFKITAGIISLLITTFIAYILGLVFKQHSAILISLIVGLIAFFTLNKWIVKKSNKVFWRIVRKQTLTLYNQLNDYTSQIVAITQFMKVGLKTEHN